MQKRLRIRQNKEKKEASLEQDKALELALAKLGADAPPRPDT